MTILIFQVFKQFYLPNDINRDFGITKHHFLKGKQLTIFCLVIIFLPKIRCFAGFEVINRPNKLQIICLLGVTHFLPENFLPNNTEEIENPEVVF